MLDANKEGSFDSEEEKGSLNFFHRLRNCSFQAYFNQSNFMVFTNCRNAQTKQK